VTEGRNNLGGMATSAEAGLTYKWFCVGREPGRTGDAESAMAIRRTTIMTSTGVRMVQIDTVVGDRATDTQYRLTTLRQAQPRLFADRALADEAFAAEVRASKLDPTALKLAIAGF